MNGRSLDSPAPAANAVVSNSVAIDQMSDAAVSTGPSWPLERWLVRRFLAACVISQVDVMFWDGRVIHATNGRAVGNVLIRARPALWRMLMNPDVGFGEGYRDGDIQIDGSLVDLMTTINHAVAQISPKSILGWLVYHP